MGKRNKRSKGELPLAAPGDSEDELVPDDDDVAFVKSHRGYGAFFGERLEVEGIRVATKRRKKGPDEDDVTAEYERAPRTVTSRAENGGDDDDAPKTLALPVKRLDGTVIHAPTAPAPIEGAGVDDNMHNITPAARAALEKAREEWDRHEKESKALDAAEAGAKKGKKARKAEQLANELGKTEYRQKLTTDKWWDKKKDGEGDDDDDDGDDDDDDGDSEDDMDPAARARLSQARAAAALEEEMSADERRESVKARVGATCQGVMEDPEGRWLDLREVCKLCEDRDGEVARLAALSMVLVFKDVCPGYRIRPPTPKELAMKVSKETQKLRDFEAGLLKMYGNFVRVLVRCGGGKGKSRSQRGKGGPDSATALRCLCVLLESLPHFNYRTDVLSALVPHLSHVDSAAADAVAGSIANAIKADMQGDTTLEALHMVAQLVKQNRCCCHPVALSPFLEIRFDEGILALEAQKAPEVLSRKQNRKKRADEREAIRKARAEKEKRKVEKERMKSFGHRDDSDSEEEDLEAQLERDMGEASGRMDNAQKKKMQSRMLEATFEMYFRVLKNAAGANPARGLPLMTPALVGLGKFTHLISVTFMADLMEVFRQLLAGDALTPEQKARCLLTACEVLSGHGEALQVDTGEFHRQLYAMLGQPSSGTTSGWGGFAGDGSGDADRGILRIRALQRFLGGYSHVDQGRVAAFAKRLAGAALCAEPGEAVGALGVSRQLLAAYPRTRCLLENERVGTGVFNPHVDDPESAVGLAAVLWDLALLRHHYHPAVAAAADEVARMPLAGAVPPALGSHAPAELARLHSTTRGDFRPAIPPPKVGKRARTSVLDRQTSRGGEANVLTPGEELARIIAVDRSADDKRDRLAPVVAALRRHFSETREFGVNAGLRAEAARLRRMSIKARERAEERRAAEAAKKAKKAEKAKRAVANGGAGEEVRAKKSKKKVKA